MNYKDELGKRYLVCLEPQHRFDMHDYELLPGNKYEKYYDLIPKGSRVLHLGCGTGREVLLGKEYGFTSTGITIGKENIKFGHETLGLNEQELVEGYCEVLPFQAEEFDYVIGCQIFEHAIAPMLFLLEQNRVLKPGGQIILEWPPCFGHGTHGADPQHQICFTPGQGQGLLLKAGFVDIKLYYNDMTEIPETNYWHGDAGYVIAIATKISTDVDYIKKYQELKG